jgi:monoamine oxidase
MLFEESLDMQATMFQPVGGMDRIPHAFAKKLGRAVQYRSSVKEIRKTARGVRIVYTSGSSEKSLEADYCICALPVPLMQPIANDFSPGVRQAIADTTYSDASKVAWESKRFWETDRNIYGGISFLTSGPVNLVWYPSAKLFSDTGVLISHYGAERGSRFGELPDTAAKLDASRAAVEKLHPGFSEQLRNPMYVHWSEIAQSQGSWVSRGGTFYESAYQAFTQPDDRFYFAGDHCSRVGAWQEGAVLAAHRAIEMMAQRIRTEDQSRTDKKRVVG